MPKRWQPGHYLQAFDQASRTTLVQSERALVSANANWKGYQIAVWWDQIEPSFGVYNFAPVLAALDAARSDGKFCWIRLIDRAFQGFAFGRPFPLYLDNAPYGWFQDIVQGQQGIVAPKLWEPATGERWLLAWEALITACDSHPACQGFTTEEYEMQGAWRQPGHTNAAMDAFWAAAARRGNAKASNSLIHINTGYGYGRDAATLKLLTDYIVSQCGGLGPTDLLRTYIGPGAPQPTLSTDFGKYIFSAAPVGHSDLTFFKTSYEWGSFDGTDTPAQLIDWAFSTLKCHFITWDPDRTTPSSTGNSWSTVLAAVNASQGKIYGVKPANVAALDVGGGGTSAQPNVPAIGNWFAKLASSANNFTTHASTNTVTWSTRSVPLGIVGTAYSATLLATGSGTLTYSIQSGTLPAGLSLTGSTGVIAGTPTAEASNAVTFRATTGGVPADITMTVSTAVAPAITTTTLASGVRGSAYLATLAGTGTAPLKWSVTGGTLPLGLTLTDAGVLSGTPLRTETVSFVVSLSNVLGSSAAVPRLFSLTIADGDSSSQGPSGVDTQWTRLPRDVEVWVKVPRDT